MKTLSLCIALAACAALAAEKQSAPTETPRPDVATRLQDAKVAKFAFGMPTSIARVGFPSLPLIRLIGQRMNHESVSAPRMKGEP